MAHLDAATRYRLERLRETDTTGVYASDEPSEGSDRSGAMTVTIDPTLRVASVQVGSIEPLRSVDALNAVFAEAYAAALAARFSDGQHAGPTVSGDRPVARRQHLTVRPPTPDMLNRHQVRVQTNTQPRMRTPREGVGVSTNECVTVTVSPVGARGRIDADPGWLQQTNAARLGAAIAEAFQAAYTRRDS
jgi:hypothetical protein